MKSGKNREQILNGNLTKAIFALAIPVVFNSFFQTMYNLTDTYWLGKLGTDELAAINLVTPLQNMIINFGSGLTVAASVLISQYLGAHRDEDARDMANEIFVCAILFALFCEIAVFLLAPDIVSWLGAEGDTYRYGKQYLQTVVFDMPFLYTVNMFAAIHQAKGDTLRPMLLNLLGICVNMVMDPLLMIVFGLDVIGAALATVLAKAVPAVIAFALLVSRNSEIRLEPGRVHFDREKLRNILVVGLPSAVGGSTMQLGFLLMTRNVMVYGTQAMAAYGIGNKVNGLISLPSNGIGSAVSIIVGQNMGAGQLDRARKGYRISRGMAVAFLFTGGMILSRKAVSTAVVGLFSDDPVVIGHAADFLSIMAFWCFTNGVHDSTSGLFRGSGHTMMNMVVDITRLWIFRLGTLYILQTRLGFGVESIWYSVVISNGLAALVLFAGYLTGFWKKKVIR